MEDLRDQFEDNKSDLNRAQFKIKALEKKVQSAKVQTDEKLEEIDKLYNETDFLMKIFSEKFDNLPYLRCLKLK